jgi:hypothetical protein
MAGTKTWEDVVGNREPTDFISSLDQFLKSYIEEDENLDKLAKECDEHGRSPVAGILRHQFLEGKVRERCSTKIGLTEYISGGLGKKQKRNPKVETLLLIYRRLFRRWLEWRMAEQGLANLRGWVFEVAPEFFGRPPSDMPEPRQKSPVRKRRKQDDPPSFDTGDASSHASATSDRTATATLEPVSALSAETSVATGASSIDPVPASSGESSVAGTQISRVSLASHIEGPEETVATSSAPLSSEFKGSKRKAEN